MNYDDWKLQTPDELGEDECGYCGEPCDGEFCDNNCKKAYLND